MGIVSLGKFYTTTEGKPVTIDRVNGYGSFPVKGSVYKKNKGLHSNPEYCIWTSIGRGRVIGSCLDDLVEVTQDIYLEALGESNDTK